MTAAVHNPPQDRPAPDAGSAFWPGLEAEPANYTLADFRQLTVNCVAAGASDITMQSEHPVTVQIAGRQVAAVRRPLTTGEASQILIGMYGSASATTLLSARQVLDFSWEIDESREVRRRFRVNATAILGRRDSQGVEVSLRVLPDTTPSPGGIGIPDDLCALLSPPNGLVVVAGATGAGKSTTLAALVHRHLVSGDAVKIVDIQAPIEFTYSDLRHVSPASSIGQSEVGTHVESFAKGVRSALRRSPDIIMIGEVRDPETARAAVDAALTGHLVYTTIHAGDVPEVLRRLQALLVAGTGTQEAAAADILHTFRAGVAQRLLRAASTLGRRPIREIAVIDSGLHRTLQAEPPETWPVVISRAIAAAPDGSAGLRPFSVDARRLVASGEINAAEAGPFLR